MLLLVFFCLGVSLVSSASIPKCNPDCAYQGCVGDPASCPPCASQKPLGYDDDKASILSFLVNLAVNMSETWNGSTSPWKWTPQCSCPYLCLDLTEFSFPYPIINSTWTEKHFELNNNVIIEKEKNVTEPFGFIAFRGSGEAYLVFRGTQTEADLRIDANETQVPYNDSSTMMVHGGFYHAFQGLQEELTSQLKDLPFGIKLYIGGHSLGSAIATLATAFAESLGMHGVQKNQASPKVGNQAFADFMNNLTSFSTYRLVNQYDLVPSSPNATDYVAIGKSVCFGAFYDPNSNASWVPITHDPCCSYSYALSDWSWPYNNYHAMCMERNGGPDGEPRLGDEYSDFPVWRARSEAL